MEWARSVIFLLRASAPFSKYENGYKIMTTADEKKEIAQLCPGIVGFFRLISTSAKPFFGTKKLFDQGRMVDGANFYSAEVRKRVFRMTQRATKTNAVLKQSTNCDNLIFFLFAVAGRWVNDVASLHLTQTIHFSTILFFYYYFFSAFFARKMAAEIKLFI